jgi:beta-lactamase regulating signal transducer with metallopeptidase domain
MTAAARSLLVVLFAGILITPGATSHALYRHVSSEGVVEFTRGFESPGVVGLVLLWAFALIPLIGLLRALNAWGRRTRTVSRLLADSDPCDEGGIPHLRFRSDDIAVFTAGAWRPVIVVSDGAADALSPRELRAALLHEQAHQRRRDVFWRALLIAVGRAFGFVPGTRKMVAEAVLRTECFADDEAIRRGATPHALFEAIVSAATSPAFGTAGLTDSAVEFRLRRLAIPGADLPAGPGTRLIFRLSLLAGVPLVGHALLLVGLACTGAY